MDAIETQKSFEVPHSNLPELHLQFEKFSKKAEKLGVTAPTYSVGPGYDVGFTRPVTDEDGLRKPYRTQEGKTPDFYVQFHTVTLEGVAPMLAGWTFVAALTHMTNEKGETMNVLRLSPFANVESLPVMYLTADPSNCDHCARKIMTRKETFIVRHEDGTFKQVGRNCIADFLGGKSAEAFLAALTILFRCVAALGDAEEGSYGSRDNRFNLLQFVSICQACIRIDGWTSGKVSYEMQVQSTKEMALGVMFPPYNMTAKQKEFVQSHQPTPEDVKLAEEALDRARSMEGELNDFSFNLKAVATQSIIDPKLAGIAAYIPAWYAREIGREIEQKLMATFRKPTGGYVGEIGKRAIFANVQVVFVKRNCASDFGAYDIFKMVDSDGHALTLFGHLDNANLGDVLNLKATPKKQENYKGQDNTVLGRGVVVTDEEVAKDLAKAARKAKKLLGYK